MSALNSKQALRQKYKTMRDGLPSLSHDDLLQIYKSLDLVIADRLYVGGYFAYRNEVPVLPEFWMKHSFDYALPVVREKGVMKFVLINSDTEYRFNRYGIKEPVFDVERYVEPDCLLMPLLAFDKKGNRLGYGGGYYDRYLAQHKEKHGHFPYRVGLAREEQAAETELIVEAHDVGLDCVVTPKRILKFTKD